VAAIACHRRIEKGINVAHLQHGSRRRRRRRRWRGRRIIVRDGGRALRLSERGIYSITQSDEEGFIRFKERVALTRTVMLFEVSPG